MIEEKQALVMMLAFLVGRNAKNQNYSTEKGLFLKYLMI